MTDSPPPLLGSRSCTHTSFLVRVELTALGQQLARRAQGVAATVIISVQGEPTVAWSVTLRIPG
jgi:hypothetical protein